MSSRNAWLDQAKAIACLVIVLHHLAFYGPMADAVRPADPALIDWLYEYGRMAVQVFLVIGGFFAAAALAPQGVGKHDAVLPALGKRYARLVIPYSAALAFAILVNEAVRDAGFEHASVSATPSWDSVIAHLLLVHSIGGWESISAGVWYVAIDFQLYALCLAWFWLSRKWDAAPWVGPLGLTMATAASLWHWNLHGALDGWALYFVGAYGMGMMAWWAGARPGTRQRWLWTGLIAAVGGVGLLIEWRARIAIATSCALMLAIAGGVDWPRALRAWSFRPLTWIGTRSYSIFLIHFPVSLLVNAAFHLGGATGVLSNALGMLMAVGLSIAAGALAHRFTEVPRPSRSRVAQWFVAAMSAGLIAAEF